MLKILFSMLFLLLVGSGDLHAQPVRDTVPKILFGKITGGTPIADVRFLKSSLNPEGGTVLLTDSYADPHVRFVTAREFSVNGIGNLFVSFDDGLTYFVSTGNGLDSGLVYDSLTAENSSVFYKNSHSVYGSFYHLGDGNHIYRVTYRDAGDSADVAISIDKARTWSNVRAFAASIEKPLQFESDPSGQRISVMTGYAPLGTFHSIYSSSNAGSSWSQIWPDPTLPEQARPSTCQWWDTLHGVIIAAPSNGTGYIANTSDGGKSWFAVVTDTSRVFYDKLHDLAFGDNYSLTLIPPSTLALGSTLAIADVVSRDGGKSFTEDTTQPGFVAASDSGRLVGLYPSQVRYPFDVGTIVSFSEDNGISWHPSNFGNNYLRLSTVAFRDKMHGLLFSQIKPVARTSDGGHTWVVIDSQHYYGIYDNYFGDIRASDGPDRGYYSAVFGIQYFDSTNFGQSDTACQVFYTSDRGTNWKMLLKPNSLKAYTIDASDGVLWLGGTGFIIHSPNGGSSFDRFALKTEARHVFVKAFHGGSCWAGNSKELYLTSNVGRSWSSNLALTIPAYSSDSDYAWTPMNGREAFASVFGSNTIYKTSDGGLTWQLVSSGRVPVAAIDSTHWLYKVPITNAYEVSRDGGSHFDTVAATGGHGPFVFVDSLRWFSQSGIMTTNGGRTWDSIPGWQFTKQFRFTIIDSTIAFGSRDFYGLARLDMPYFRGTAQGVPKEQPNDVQLLSSISVYPQPARATSTIQFDLARDANVRVMVFNVEGQRILGGGSHLLSSGRHQVKFGVDRLTAGDYFVRIETSNESQTLKFVVVK
jgi:photosystem II stability/assembly factor-like uncharacterized protein